MTQNVQFVIFQCSLHLEVGLWPVASMLPLPRLGMHVKVASARKE